MDRLRNAWCPALWAVLVGSPLFCVSLSACLAVGALDARAPKAVEPALPAFDHSKATRLSAEKRRQYDLEFFNQLFVRHEGDTWARYRLFRSMADDGFEVAYLALKLLDIPRGATHFDQTAWHRLGQLIKTDDVSAKCFYGIYGQAFDHSAGDDKARRENIAAAAAQKHPGCLGAYGNYFEQTLEQELNQILEGAKLGDLLSQSKLVSIYMTGKGVPQDFGRAMCWSEIALRSNTDWARVERNSVLSQIHLQTFKGKKALVKTYNPETFCANPSEQ